MFDIHGKGMQEIKKKQSEMIKNSDKEFNGFTTQEDSQKREKRIRADR